MTRRFVLGVAMIACLSLLPAQVATQSPSPLFVAFAPGSAIAAMDATPSAAVADRQPIGMRLDALFGASGAQPRVLLNLDGQEWVARLQRVDGDALGFRSWVGEIEGIQYSHVVFTERDGTVSGLINAVSTTYRVRTTAPGAYLLERMSANTSRGDSEPLPGAIQTQPFAADALEAAHDSASTIDVLMLYSPNAKAHAGGPSQIQAVASQIISDSNTIFSRSNITTRLRLAGTVEFSLVEASSMATDLNLVTDSTLSRSLRDTYRA